MTKYCEACHTANKDRARYCVGCAGKFSGVRTSALTPTPFEERQAPTPWATDIAAGRPAKPAAAALAKTVEEATTRSRAQGGGSTFARTAAGAPLRTFARTHPSTPARTLARTSPRPLARALHDGVPPANARGSAQSAAAPLKPEVAPQGAPAPDRTGARRNSNAFTLLLSTVAILLVAVLAIREGSHFFEDDPALAVVPPTQPQQSAVTTTDLQPLPATSASVAVAPPIAEPQPPEPSPVAQAPSLEPQPERTVSAQEQLREPPQAKPSHDSLLALAVERSANEERDLQAPPAKPPQILHPQPFATSASNASASSTQKDASTAPRDRIAPRIGTARNAPRKQMGNAEPIVAQRLIQPALPRIESSLPMPRQAVPVPVAVPLQTAASGTATSWPPCDRHNPFGEVICINAPAAAASMQTANGTSTISTYAKGPIAVAARPTNAGTGGPGSSSSDGGIGGTGASTGADSAGGSASGSAAGAGGGGGGPRGGGGPGGGNGR